MAAPVFQKVYTQDLAKPLEVRYGGGLMFTGDALADTITVNLMLNGEPYEAGGTVACKCIRADGATVSVVGSSSGNSISATLTAACYAVAGPLAVVMTVTEDSVSTTVLKAVYMVDAGSTGTTIDPGTVITDIDSLIAAIEAAVDTIPASYSSLLATIAPTFSSSTAYTSGQYVWYSGTLYRFAVDHAAGSWNSSHVMSVAVGQDMYEGSTMRGEISAAYGVNFFNPYARFQNTFLNSSSGAAEASPLYDCSDFIAVGSNTKYTFKLFSYSGTPNFMTYEYNSSKGFIKRTSNKNYITGRTFNFQSGTAYIRFLIDKTTTGYVDPYQIMAVWGEATISEFVPYYTAYDRTGREQTATVGETSLRIKYGAYSGSDANDVDENSRYSCLASGVAHLPSSGSGAYILDTTFTTSNHNNGIQIAYNLADGRRYWRQKNGGTWESTWHTYDRAISARKYVAYGDSLMYGAKWISTETDPYYEIVRTATANQMPTRIANGVGIVDFTNAAVGGAYFVGSGSNTIYAQVTATNFTDVGLVTIAGGRNDSSSTLGDKNSTSGGDTICGKIKQIIEYIQTQNPKTQIVVVSVTPNTNDNSTVFTKTYAGGWSLNTYEEKVSELCAEYGVPFVGWKQCTIIRHWANFTGAGGNYAHPNNDESYLQMGNYLAGQVAQYYRA